MRVPLHLIHIPEYDGLLAVEYGRVAGGQPPGSWRPVGDHVGYLYDGPRGPALGFKVLDLGALDVADPTVSEIWGPPRFDVPILGLTASPAAEIILAARAFFEDRASVGDEFMVRAVAASGEDALDPWRCCLESGDVDAHFGLGLALQELGRHREAYRHLRYYTTLAPYDGWAWCFYGSAAEALGLHGEARTAYRRAIELEAVDGEVTDARDRLADLDARRPAPDPAPAPRRRSWRRR